MIVNEAGDLGFHRMAYELVEIKSAEPFATEDTEEHEGLQKPLTAKVAKDCPKDAKKRQGSPRDCSCPGIMGPAVRLL
jgi:hypothetical protein